MKVFAILTCLAMCAFQGLTAHAGCEHHHDSITPPHGGQLEHTDSELLVELVEEEGNLQVYVMDHDLNLLPVAQVALQGYVEFPRGRQENLEVSFLKNQDHFFSEVTVSPRVYRYTLVLTAEYQGETTNVQFVIEK